MAGHVTVVGEALTDIVLAADSVSEHPGGSPMNVSFGLGRLGVPVTFVTRLGTDDRGRRIAAHLTSAGVALDPAPSAAVRTSSAKAVLAADGSADYHFDVQWELAPVPASAGASHLHFGSISAFLAPGATLVEGMARDYASVATVSYDPNIRPQFLESHAHAVEAVERHVALADVVKASDEDIEWLYPGVSVLEVARQWQKRGPAIVAVTHGEGGATLLTELAVVEAGARLVTVADTIGAGDSFMAGLIAGLYERDLVGASRREALHGISQDALRAVAQKATLCAALTVGRTGAMPPTADELRAATELA